MAQFIQHLAVNYVSRGYIFYVKGEIPPHKDPAKTDAKIIARYEIDISKWARFRRKRRGGAGVQYLRLGRQFVIIATHGAHRFAVEEAKEIRDVRRYPLKVSGYSISYREGRPKAMFPFE